LPSPLRSPTHAKWIEPPLRMGTVKLALAWPTNVVAAAPARDDRIAIGDVVLESSMRRVTLAGEEVELTRKEYELLALLMRNAGTVLTRERLIDEVWDTNWYGSTKTLDVHVSGLRKKLGDDAGTPRYVHTLRGVGFRFSAPDEAG